MDLFDIEEAAKESDLSLQNFSRIRELEKLITKYQDSYYNGEAEVEDAVFDKLWDELKALDPINPILHKVGADSGNFLKAKHVMPMGSQEKAACDEEFLDWAQKHVYDKYLVEYKLDGASLELQYVDGKLLRAVTRGDGETGDVITQNASKMQGVLHQLTTKDGKIFNFTGGIRGEVIMTHQVHEKFYSDKANCRNAANGLMKRKDGEGSEHLKLITYDIWSTTDSQPFSTEIEKMQLLEDLGFITSPLQICKNPQEVINYRVQVMETRKNLEYDIDGLVIKENVINHEDASRDRPDRQIAFKFSLEEAVSILREVEWNEEGATYTPVAIFDSVELNGTTVKRASLVNTNLIKALNLKIGSHVVVVKRGEIIPKIMNVVEGSSDIQTSPIIVPCVCSTCNTPLVDEGTRLYCPNKSCSKRILHQLLKWINVVDIRDLGRTLITELFNTKTVTSISDIYKLTEEVLTPFFLNDESISKEKESLGAKKVYNSIQNHKKITLARFVAGLDIEGIGETQVEKIIASGFNTIDKILNVTVEEICSVFGFAEISAKTFVQGIKENRNEIENLVNNALVEIQQGENNGALKDLSFCFTGELRTMKRADAQNMVKEKGGTVKSSVVKGLSYLVTNDTTSGSSKNLKAQQLGVKVINEEEFIQLLGN